MPKYEYFNIKTPLKVNCLFFLTAKFHLKKRFIAVLNIEKNFI